MLLTIPVAYSQSISEGNKYFYYERYKSAQSVFEKIIKGDAKNAEAWYWLALSQLGLNKLEEANTTVKNGLAKTNNHPLLQIAMGHIYVLENNITEAKNYFTKALTSAGKVPKEILQAAIGRACADGNSRQGDPNYGIEVLKAAAQTDTKNPELYILMGICHLKMGSDKGGDAVEAYRKALLIDPLYAKAYYRIGRIYQSQNNIEIMNSSYDEAIQADNKFAPVYQSRFIHYEQRDRAEAQKNLDLYIRNTDQDCDVFIFQADYYRRSGKYKESIDKLKQVEQGICKDEPRIKILFALNYLGTGDSASARSAIEKFLGTVNAVKIQANDYKLAGEILSKFSGQENKAADYYQQYIDKDTLKSNKLTAMLICAKLFEKTKNYTKTADWFQKIINFKEKPTSLDYYNCGRSYYLSGNYNSSISIFKTYIDKYPTDWRGPFWEARSNAAIDSTMTTWVAVPYYEKFILLAEKDASVSKQLPEAYLYLFAYQYNHKKDKVAATNYLDKALAVDPNNVNAKQYKALLNQ